MSFKILNCYVETHCQIDAEFATKGTVHRFSDITSITTDESYEYVINKAEIKLSNGLYFNEEGKADTRTPRQVMSRGDIVYIKMWYNRDLTDEPIDEKTELNRYAFFTGYISGFDEGKDYTIIQCENQMWELNRTTVNFPADNLVSEGTGNAVRSVYYADPINKTGEFDPKKVTLQDFIDSVFLNVEYNMIEVPDAQDWDNKEHEVETFNLLEQYATALSDVNLGQLVIENVKIPEVLEEIRKAYNIVSYWHFNTLIIGSTVSSSTNTPTASAVNDIQKTTNNLKETDLFFTIGWDIIDDTNLKFQFADEVLMTVYPKIYSGSKPRPILIDPKSKSLYIVQKGTPDTVKGSLKHTVYGDDLGSKRDIFFQGQYTQNTDGSLTDASYLDVGAMCDRELEAHKYTGYRGSFITFGETVAYPGDICDLEDVRDVVRIDVKNSIDIVPGWDKQDKSRNGRYVIRSVRRLFDAQNAKYRQEIELGAYVGASVNAPVDETIKDKERLPVKDKLYYSQKFMPL